MSTSAIRVAVVDGRELSRRGLALLLDDRDEFEVVAAVAGVGELAVVPDVALVDGSDPGLDACSALQQLAPTARILVLTDAGDADPFAAMGAGALGLLHREASLGELVEGIGVVAEGHTLVSSSMTARMVSGFRDTNGSANGHGKLTARESEVLLLVAGGLSNREIGLKLGIAENTAKNHVRNLLEKLRLRSRTEAAMYAVREKLVEP
ncbi:response regulator transcription factor [Nocardioides panacisoli]|uniref:LuxR C-terminal-related transcriptional regulator n=1 Tax=Nocardioides panacisoli TaxID=627624 RepID=UPI001C6248AC|nr:response regulator transcription factor [Nocardioides panacisoli]QYJ04419.1 response regulator transcription factor [Nocardioides panacisoli]